MNCGLLGRKLRHSYSPQIHAFLGEYAYQLFEKEPEDLDSFFHTADFTGLNVTIPYKKDVLPYCDELSPVAKKLGAVNTIVKKPDGKLVGHNTDVYGFTSMVRKTGLNITGKKALVLGSGGAAATVLYVLQEMGAYPVVISRNGANNYTNLHLHADAALIVNATPVGMYPNVNASPVDLTIFPKLEGVLDLIYNPSQTNLLRQAAELGLTAENGLWMLVAQAKESAEWFCGHPINDSIIDSIYRSLQFSMKNIVLIGMPGCGKSTVGKILAEKLGRTFVDADCLIQEKADMPIPEIFATQGEEGFRKIETEVLSELSSLSTLVIATGGGCVTRKENLPLLQRNSLIIWLKRDLSKLPTHGRPLSQTTSLEQMYAVRKPLYNQFADKTIDNNGNTNDTVSAIMNLGGLS